MTGKNCIAFAMPDHITASSLHSSLQMNSRANVVLLSVLPTLSALSQYLTTYDCVIIPSLDRPLTSTLSEGMKAALRNFVAGGGRLVQLINSVNRVPGVATLKDLFDISLEASDCNKTSVSLETSKVRMQLSFWC
jgi:hypothetical protein